MKKQYNKSMNKWLTIHTVIILLISVSATLFVETVAYGQGNGDFFNGLFRALGVIIPMCLLLAFYNVFMFRQAYKHINVMNNGIEKIANGDFAVRLDAKDAKSMTEVYENINIMAQELQNMAVMRNDFINNYSHEFKTPIASINGFAELLLNNEIDEIDKKMYLQVIYDESARLAELADKTIMLSRIDNQRIVENKKTYSLDEQLRQCSILLSRQWTDKKINISGDIDRIDFYGNEELMKQLWLNLLSNAIKFTPNGGDIFVTLKKDKDKIDLSVRDSGKGMSKEDTLRIFDKYFQADKSGQNAGLGLGLSIAKRIVELCEGDIKVSSVINEGSTFNVTLPL